MVSLFAHKSLALRPCAALLTGVLALFTGVLAILSCSWSLRSAAAVFVDVPRSLHYRSCEIEKKIDTQKVVTSATFDHAWASLLQQNDVP